MNQLVGVSANNRYNFPYPFFQYIQYAWSDTKNHWWSADSGGCETVPTLVKLKIPKAAHEIVSLF
jgi:hypothetical protein